MDGAGRYARCERFRSASFPAALLVHLLLGACSSPPDDVVSEQVATRRIAEDMTSAGRWRAVGAVASRFRNANPVAGESNELDLPMRVMPVVSTKPDLSVFLVGRDLGPDFLANRMAWYMQVVPGLPARYGDSKFNEVRDAFTSECKASASGYQATAISLFGSTRFSIDIAGAEVRTVGRSYDRDCLVALDSLPTAIRRVTGVLITPRGAPWCSATIVGPKSLITARHCFVDPLTGLATDQFAQLTDGRIGFLAVEAHYGKVDFSTRWFNSVKAPLGQFGPLEDRQLLEISDGAFEHYAVAHAAAISNADMPIPVWIVGSNANLGQLGTGMPPLDYARGSAPRACAILEISSAGCLYHSCQTGGGTSGAGVLAVTPSGAVELLGVHKAAIGEAAGCELSPPFGVKINLAIRIDSTLTGS